ncbi:MAG: leucine-rich repeat domain-containing protein [Thermoguttaceae bacterium]|nr:leucine-rich repeat domain-containing protein [Thermoguttaceae bacterium]
MKRGDGPFSISDGALLGDYGKTFLWFPTTDRRRRFVVPDGVKTIGAQAFGAIQGHKASHLEEVVLPDGLEIIGKEAFTDCYQLEKVVLPESVKFIGEHAFRGCAMRELVIPDGIEKICRWAFNYCFDLVLRGSEGSYAQEYAEKNKIPFKPL